MNDLGSQIYEINQKFFDKALLFIDVGLKHLMSRLAFLYLNTHVSICRRLNACSVGFIVGCGFCRNRLKFQCISLGNMCG